MNFCVHPYLLHMYKVFNHRSPGGRVGLAVSNEVFQTPDKKNFIHPLQT